MSRMFGWSLPPGVTQRMIDEQCEDGPCAVCGRSIDACLCPECPTCGAQGDPSCYDHHDLTRSAFQIASYREAVERWWNEDDHPPMSDWDQDE